MTCGKFQVMGRTYPVVTHRQGCDGKCGTGEPTPENPLYSKFKQDDGKATSLYGISVDEGWRSWILCADMYEDVADQLLEVLRASGKTWRY